MNCYGSIDIRATKVGANSSLQKMIQLVKEADEKKAPMQRIVDKWATWLVPIALLLAVLAWGVTGEMERGVTVLVVFCPCALALATPVSIIAGIGQATKFGVLIKSGEALERMGQIDTLAFDKTGTITKGSLSVSDMMSVNADMADEEMLMVTASAESRSEHPLGKAIVKESEDRGLSLLSVESFEMMPGKGIKALVDGKAVICGKAGWLEESGIGISPTTIELLDRLRSEGKATIVTAVDGKCVGVIALSDIVRPDAAKSIEELENIGLSVVLLTGDNGKTASFIASKVGISNVRAELLPAEKLSAIETMQCDGHRVVMVGDGVNDAPALKTADVGIAMGSIGSDIAIESADIALMGDDISLLPYLKRLSNAVTRSIQVNITLSMAINFVAIAMSFLGWLNPVTGALVHNAGSVLVVLNAALL
ncbi:MAG: cation-translocating P-type ATPase, partial [Bacteroidaceae bacterium]|nr:cation-translocating P-type ATPase [Bacteroidaceae bacterium]